MQTFHSGDRDTEIRLVLGMSQWGKLPVPTCTTTWICPQVPEEGSRRGSQSECYQSGRIFGSRGSQYLFNSLSSPGNTDGFAQRHKLGSNLTPVTPETFAVWKKTRMDKKEAEQEASRKTKELQSSAGKSSGMSGRDLVRRYRSYFGFNLVLISA